MLLGVAHADRTNRRPPRAGLPCGHPCMVWASTNTELQETILTPRVTPVRSTGTRAPEGWILLRDVASSYRDGAEQALFDQMAGAADLRADSDELISRVHPRAPAAVQGAPARHGGSRGAGPRAVPVTEPSEASAGRPDTRSGPVARCVDAVGPSSREWA